MDESQRSQVQHALERMTGKRIQLETRVQPNILGGVVARVGDQVIDGSVERRLKLLQQQLLTDVSTASNDFFTESGTEETKPSTDGNRPAYQPQP
jgi:F-type H+-transporting ATPase subunit delta